MYILPDEIYAYAKVHTRDPHSSPLKSPHEAPKQLLELRSTGSSRRYWERPEPPRSPQPSIGHEKLQLKFIEKENRKIARAGQQAVLTPSLVAIRNTKAPRMQSVQSTQYLPYDAVPYHHGNLQYHNNHLSRSVTAIKSAGLPSFMRAPSSGISSASSSENMMMSGLSICSDEEKKLREDLLDPAVEVDLEIFMHKPPVPTKFLTRFSSDDELRRLNFPMRPAAATQHPPLPQQQQQLPPPQPSQNVQQQLNRTFADYSYSHIKQMPEYHDFAFLPPYPSTSKNSAHPQPPPTSTIPSLMAPRQCSYCWESYVNLCKRITNKEPVFPCEGPWSWHSLYDGAGKVTCPRLWFVQMDRAGNDMVQQMIQKSNQAVF